MSIQATKLSTVTKLPGSQGFIFDVIIVRIDLPKIEIDDASKLTVDVKFNKSNIQITSSRINVDEFKSGRSCEFTEYPSVLKDQLLNNPLTCKVSYQNETIGNCVFIWPDSFLNCITDSAGELIHCDKVDIKDKDETVGKMEIIIRLQIKCHEFDEKMETGPKSNICNLKDSVIDPNDILFVVGEDKNENNNNSCVCAQVGIIPASDSGESINPTSLDLSYFRSVNGRTVANTDILNSIDTGCCKLKKSTNNYQEIIESLMSKPIKRPCCLKNSEEPQKLTCEEQIKPVDCVSGTKFTGSSSSSETSNPYRCISNESNLDGMICRKDCDTEKQTKRYCPLCQENITWLPKFNACPKCGFKSIEYPEEKPYDDQLTADKVLQEFLDKNCGLKTVPSGVSQPPKASTCRCSCRNGKICAHCRIKKLCEDIFQPSGKDKQDCGKCEAKSSDMYNVCKTSSNDCRPYLAKVFQELKDLYATRENKKKIEESKGVSEQQMGYDITSALQSKQLNELEKEHTQKSKSHRFHHKNDVLAVERKNFLAKNLNKQNSPCKGKIFDYRTKRKYPGTKIGHKTCINGYAGRKNVPRNMGWLWSAEATGVRDGWKPGAIRKPIKVLMKYFLSHKTSDNLNNQQEQLLSCNILSHKNDGNDEDFTKKPTLHICKKNGDYYITLRPLKDAEALKECCNPYIDMKPIQFKITKNTELMEMRNLKQNLKTMGFRKCTCHKPISYCCCRTFLEKKKLEYQCHKECQRRNLPACTDSLVLSDTSDSEIEFDFGVTPPAGVPHPDRCIKKKIKVNTSTQYVENDWNITPEYPKQVGKYEKLYNCAVGERFGKAFGPYGFKGYTAGATPIQQDTYGSCGFMSRSAGKGDPGGLAGRGKVPGGKKGVAIEGPQAYLGPDGKFSMAKYMAVKAFKKPSPAAIAEKKKQKMALLKGTNPPLLCMVDRRGKPFNPCAPCLPRHCDSACLRDNRIC